ncbi:MAG: hypothetical protein FJ290_00675 [Planctomycetes bacterium]|nr:hypothetical protein [Planctomycetota bacterium]
MNPLSNWSPFTRTLAIACALLPGAGTARAVTITNVTVAARDAGTATVAFDIAWDNSWRHEINHDAAWVFFKVRAEGATEWQHVRLAADKVLNPTGYSQEKGGTPLDLIVPDGRDGFTGMFVRRAEYAAPGKVATSKVSAVWDLTANKGITRDTKVQVRPFGIEMVYVAEGPFCLGSGGAEINGFYTYTDGSQHTQPFRVTSAGAIPTGRRNGRLWARKGAQPEDGGEIPASFPNGYAALYCMKHRIGSAQYAAFLNTLSAAEADKLRSERTVVRSGEGPNSTYSGRSADAADGLSWADSAALAAWAALRPMTELECEKLVRGPREPVPDEVHPSYWNIPYPDGFWNSLLHDGTESNVRGQFSAGDTTDPFRIESEDALTLGGQSSKNLGNRDGLGQRMADDFTSCVTQTLPARFPKGFAAFYCTRHEITQGEYVDFLNTLTYEEQRRLTRGRPEAAAGTLVAGEASKWRNGVKIAVPGASSSVQEVSRRDGVIRSIGGAKPAVYATDTPFVAYGAGHPHQITVTGGPHGPAANGVSYAAWAGLRPMTELEYEKACRGPLKPVPGEFAWGTNQIAGTNNPNPPRDGYALRNAGKPDECVVWEGDNGPDAVRGNAAWGGTMSQAGGDGLFARNAINGPLRVGAFATPHSGRVAAGASYWGILDLTGNLWEELILVGNVAGPWDDTRNRRDGRRFAGTHGDGTLAQPPGWDAIGQRGGAADSPRPETTSNRTGYGPGSSGFRCVRTAP